MIFIGTKYHLTNIKKMFIIETSPFEKVYYLPAGYCFLIAVKTIGVLMTLAEVKAILEAELLTHDQNELSNQVYSACASDMMSDVLAFTEPEALVITGLASQQTLRTVQIADAVAVVFVRGKRPAADIISEANRKKIPLMTTEFCMYDACGLLFNRGLCGVTEQVRKILGKNDCR
jgi:predicted transcriptional regulator